MNNILIEQDSKEAWIRLIIIFSMSVIGTAGMWSVVIIMPSIQNEFSLDRAASTYPYVATMFGYGIGNVIIGRLLDKIGIRKPIIFALTLLVASYLLDYEDSKVSCGLGVSEGGDCKIESDKVPVAL